MVVDEHRKNLPMTQQAIDEVLVMLQRKKECLELEREISILRRQIAENNGVTQKREEEMQLRKAAFPIKQEEVNTRLILSIQEMLIEAISRQDQLRQRIQVPPVISSGNQFPSSSAKLSSSSDPPNGWSP